MSVDTAFARLRDANPVPEPARLRDKSQDLNALLAATKQRSMEMDSELEIVETQKTPTPTWRKAMPGLVAAAVVILVGAAILLLARDTEPDVAGTPQSTSSEPTATFTGAACDYDGPSEFDLNSTVTFTVTNESAWTEVSFTIWKLPSGVTSEEILADGIFNVSTPEDTLVTGISAPTAIGDSGAMSVFLDSPGQWGISCDDVSGIDHDGAGLNYVTMFTVNG